MRAASLVLSTLATMAAGAPAAAQDLPRYDIRLFCAANGGERGGMAGCMRIEEAARQEMAGRWESFPKQRRHFCVQTVSFRKREQRSYTDLSDCLKDTKTS